MSKKVVHWLLTALLLAFGLNLFCIGAGLLAADQDYQEAAEALYSVGLWSGLFKYGVLVPILEEFLFRGVIFKTAGRFLKPWSAVLVSAVLFGVYHGNAVQIVYGFCMGLVLAWAYQDTGHFWVPVLLHGVVNVSVFLTSSFYLFPEGGIALIGGLIFMGLGGFLFIKANKH